VVPPADGDAVAPAPCQERPQGEAKPGGDVLVGVEHRLVREGTANTSCARHSTLRNRGTCFLRSRTSWARNSRCHEATLVGATEGLRRPFPQVDGPITGLI
jgi:hypothetical protein